MVAEKKIYEIKNGKVWVTFNMPAIEGCDCLYLVGKFDEWDQSVYRMRRAEDGSWSLALELEPGCDYQYCYRTDNGVWHNRPTASMVVQTPDEADGPVIRLQSVRNTFPAGTAENLPVDFLVQDQ